ncbi:MAG: zf-HC2 domain-containing protein [Candidatus Marinimicrobia bacterium]|nr:zf-HC2 domain-containing protein [Candidatus Neomarinimicrobiota bacterium]MCF7829429.1 zf-HC2 domain-containing protein [Candidatus Neomarinimicrobiota bacterium]MCF7880915.1 zf-HC2 domain-containing protein [Candidatus Neomarinimicrobiota bacterium]
MKTTIMMHVIKPVIDKLTPSCEIISQQISRSMDSPLSLKERMQVRVHLMACKLCTRYRNQLLAIRQKIRDQTEAWDADSDISEFHLSPEKREQIKEKMRDSASDSTNK